jgi:hypothetical protein
MPDRKQGIMFAAYLKISVKPIGDRYNDKAKVSTQRIDNLDPYHLQGIGLSESVARSIMNLADSDIVFTAAEITVGKESVKVSIITTELD